MKITMKKQAIPMIAVALGVGALVYAVYSVEPPGYCSAQQGFLSDNDFIKSALRAETQHGALKLDGTDVSIIHFLVDNPQCCTVDRTPRSLLERRVGINTVGVDLRYAASSELSYETHLEASACGQMRTRRAYEIKTEVIPISRS